jgi:hypothetical protein
LCVSRKLARKVMASNLSALGFSRARAVSALLRAGWSFSEMYSLAASASSNGSRTWLGKKNLISRTALFGESEPWVAF